MLKLKLENEYLYGVYKFRWYWTNKRIGEIFYSEPYWSGAMRLKGLPMRTQTSKEASETRQFRANKDLYTIFDKMKLLA